MLILRSKKVMTRIEHPFAKVCRAVLKEKYPDKAIPDDSPLTVNDIPEDVLSEASKRYYAGKELIIGPCVRVKLANKQKVKYTTTYV
jgi:hypothetical protein